ncbi:MAG: hypothetical protein M3R15_35115, partial [Acidobacteriota bacterium]|nr:hypothetical protein [Acidobacteriota bacterium]
LNVFNTHGSTSNAIEIQHTDGTTVETLWKGTLQAGESVKYDGDDWSFFSSGGVIVTSVGGVQLNDVHSGYSEYQVIANPSVPAADTLRWYARKIAGRVMPKWMPPSGLDMVAQPSLFGNRMCMFGPMNAAVGTGTNAFGPLWTSNGTVSHPTPAITAPAISNQMKRTRYANIATTADQQLGPRFNAVTEQQFWMGNTAGLGGFFFFARFVVDLIPAATVRLFAGLSNTATGSVCISNTVLNDTCGLWHDTTDGLSTFNFVTRNTVTTTKQAIALSNAIAAGNSYDFYIYCKPGDSTLYWRLDDIVNNVTYENSQTVTLPTSTAFMQPQVQMSNGANGTVTTSAIGVVGIYVESDR